MRNLIGSALAVVAAIAANLLHGVHGGAAFFLGLGRRVAWITTPVLRGAALASIGFAVNQRWDDIFIGIAGKDTNLTDYDSCSSH
jgi:hypothetical protein